MSPLFDRFRTKGIFLVMCVDLNVQCGKAFPYDIEHYIRMHVNSVVVIVFFAFFDLIN